MINGNIDLDKRIFDYILLHDLKNCLDGYLKERPWTRLRLYPTEGVQLYCNCYGSWQNSPPAFTLEPELMCEFFALCGYFWRHAFCGDHEIVELKIVILSHEPGARDIESTKTFRSLEEAAEFIIGGAFR